MGLWRVNKAERSDTISNKFNEAIIGYYDRNDKFHNTACLSYDPVLQSLMQHLDNSIEQPDCMPYQEDNSDMVKINRAVMISGEKKWIRANTEQEYADKLLKLTGTNQPEPKIKHLFCDYALTWFEVYSRPNIETV